MLPENTDNIGKEVFGGLAWIVKDKMITNSHSNTRDNKYCGEPKNYSSSRRY